MMITDPFDKLPFPFVESKVAPSCSLYLVIDLNTEEKGFFSTAHDVAAFMWGRDYTRYRLYRYRPWPSGDLRKALETP